MSTEMWLAAAEVVPRRVARMATAKLPLSKRDRKEFTVMGSEKVDAAVLGLNAVAWELAFAAPRLAAGQLVQVQTLARTALKPAHKRVTANARRLRRG